MSGFGALGVIGAGLEAQGTVRSARGLRARGRRAVAIADMNAQRRVAAGQRAGFEEERQAQLAASRALALAAASGRAVNKSAENIIADIGAEGVYRQAVQVYEAEEDARMMRIAGRAEASTLDEQARATIYAGRVNFFSSMGGSLFGKYGGGGPGSGTDT